MVLLRSKSSMRCSLFEEMHFLRNNIEPYLWFCYAQKRVCDKISLWRLAVGLTFVLFHWLSSTVFGSALARTKLSIRVGITATSSLYVKTEASRDFVILRRRTKNLPDKHNYPMF